MTRDAATQRQVEAANPRVSTWLSANAGSGKTRVLTDRVARLLLDGVSPQNILCLTYTKAAAAEMQNRLFKRLGEWAMKDDAALRKDLADLGLDHRLTATELSQARTLFARAIETPGGLKIQTIHAFCGGLLRRFPLEAQVSPQFREIEEQDAARLRAEVVDDMLSGDHAGLVQAVLDDFTGSDFSDFTAEVTGRRDAFQGPFDPDKIAADLGLAPNPQAQDALKLAFIGDEPDLATSIGEAFADQSKTYQTFAQKLAQLNLRTPGMADLQALFGLFLYAKVDSSKSVNFPQSNHSKAVTAMAPIADEVHAWMDRVAAAKDLLKAINAYHRAIALNAFAMAFLPAYEKRKQQMGALDFEDLISKAKALLTDPRVAAWVLFRLDGGIDHVLVDEAQDTSPNQWAVVRQLTQEFAAGEGAQPDRERTVFVVGDKKQSIYSFQGADPAAFDGMNGHFQSAFQAIEKPFETTSLDHSFRSAQAILSVVDATFVDDLAAGMDDHLSHIAFKNTMPGRVDLWPVIEKIDAKDDRPWDSPIDQPGPKDHTVQLAHQIAAQIKHMITHDTLPQAIDQQGNYGRRPITAGDVLILVQRRSDIFAEIIRACKAAGLPVAGADRLRVGAELAVKDLTALLRFLALPEDDLSLASALRSPLFGYSEQQLFTLAHGRPDDSYLWPALRDSGDSETIAILGDLREQADFLRPYDLIERILIRHDGRRKLLARLGQEAEDGIDALLQQALAYEGHSTPSLTGFLSWMATDDLEIKRQMDNQGDRIRVMTVHGAKGLEAPIVILPDTTTRKNEVKANLIRSENAVLWKTKTEAAPQAIRDLLDTTLEKQQQERARLLYVAMTRAENWLIVAAAGDVGEDNGSWYNIVAAGMARRGAGTATSGPLTIQRVADHDWDAGPLITPDTTPQVTVTPPDFGPVAAVSPTGTISPSALKGPKTLPGEPEDSDPDAALARGSAMHLLLEYLPHAAPADRPGLGAQLVAPEHHPLIADAVQLIADPALAPLWTDAALTETDITADIPTLGRIHGAIDRLIITDDQVLAIDYKTNRLTPDTAAQTPLGLLRQMAAYAAALRQIYPDRPVQMAILWTQTRHLMTLPPELLSDALASS